MALLVKRVMPFSAINQPQMNSTDKNSKYYNDLKWFSNINYTTTTEYFGELKLFLLDIVNLDEFKHYKSDLLDIINQISQILN